MLHLLTVHLVWAAAGFDNPPASEYVFVPNTSRYVCMLRGGKQYLGKLDATGKFSPDPSRAPIDRNAAFISGPYFVMLNNGVSRPWPAYEYRSGKLVLGQIERDGTFTEQPGAKPVPFANYNYFPRSDDSPGSVPIYNLPGYFWKRTPPRND